jgi:hypothetical protein
MSGSGRRKKYGGLRTAKRRFSAFGGAKALARGMMLQGLGRKRRVHRVGGRKMRGGFLGSLFNKVKDVVTGVPILSTGAKLLGHNTAGHVLKAVGLGRRRHVGGRKSAHRGRGMLGSLLGMAGLGRRRVHRRKRVHRGGASVFGGRRHVRRGRGIMDVLKKAHNFVKDRQLISKGLNLIQHPHAEKASSIAGILGYGRKRRRVGGRKRKGVSLKKLIMGGSVYGGARPSFMKPRRRGLLLGSKKF